MLRQLSMERAILIKLRQKPQWKLYRYLAFELEYTSYIIGDGFGLGPLSLGKTYAPVGDGRLDE